MAGKMPGTASSASPGFDVALEPLQSLCSTAGDLPAQLRHCFRECCTQSVVACFGINIRARCDQVDVDLIRRAGVLEADEADIRFINLPGATEGKYLFFHPRIQRIEGTDV